MKRWIPLVLLSLICTLAQGRDQSAVKLKEQADQQVKMGSNAKAISGYQQAIAADPNYMDAYQALANVHLTSSRFAEAAKVLNQAVKRDPKFAPGWYNLAYALRKMGDLDAAINAYHQFIKIEPKRSDAHYGLGLAYQAKGDPATAATEFRKYAKMEKDPKKLSWVKKANKLATDLERKAKEQADKKELAAIGKTNGDAKKPAPGTSKETKKPVDAAKGAEAKANAKANAGTPAPKGKDATAAKAGDKPAATVAKAATTAPRKGELAVEISVPKPAKPGKTTTVAGQLRAKADNLARAGKCVQAKPFYKQALKQDPFHVGAYDGLSYCAYLDKKPALGVSLMRTALRDNPDYQRGWLNLARLQFLAGNPTAALGTYRKAVKRPDKDADAIFELGYVLADVGHKKDATRAYQNYLNVEKRSDRKVRRKAAQKQLAAWGASTEKPSAPAAGAVVSAPLAAAPSAGAGSADPAAANNSHAGSRKLTAKEKRAEARRLRAEAKRAKREARKQRRLEARKQKAERRKARAESKRIRRQELARRRAELKAQRKEARRKKREAKLAKRKGRTSDDDEDARLARLEATRKNRVKHTDESRQAEDLAGRVSEESAGTPRMPRERKIDVLEPAPEAAAGLAKVADKLFAQQRYVAALGVYQQAAALDPTGTEVLYKAAVTAVALRRMHRAAHLFERVLQLNPGNYTAAVNLKLARAAAKSMKPSADYLQESIEKARRYLQSGRYALAEQLLTSVAEHHTAAAVFQLRAEARLALRRPRLALSDGGRSLALNPGMIDALRVMGDGHRQLGHAKKARYYYQLYLTRSSSDPTAAATRSAIEKAMQELR